MATKDTQNKNQNKKIYLSKENVISISGGSSQIGVFFDGTGNNMNVDIPKNAETNIVKLQMLYKVREKNNKKIDHKTYIIGVGSTTGMLTLGGGFGAGATSRIESAYNEVKEFLNQPHIKYRKTKFIDVFGFSRGAASARHFVNMVKYEPFEDDKIKGKLIKGVKIRFLGIFDTVGSFGIPGNEMNYGFDLHVDTEFVQKTVHFTAEHEKRTLFDLTSIKIAKQEALPGNMIERSFPGVHSDIGGGYQFQAYRKGQWVKDRKVDGKITPVSASDKKFDQDKFLPDDYEAEYNDFEEYYLKEIPKKSNHLSRIPLREMYNEAIKTNIIFVPMGESPTYVDRMQVSFDVDAFYQKNKSGMPFDEAMKSEYIHDSRYVIDKMGTAMFGDDNVREIFYPDPDPISWKNKKEIEEQWNNPDSEYN